jgi:hypothetical protein
MKISVCGATLYTASIIVVGALGLSGCGSVTAVENDGGGGSAGGSGGTSGAAGRGGSSGTGGTTGTAGAAGTAAGGRGGTDAGGSGGAAAGGRGGSDGSGRGGAAAGGRGGTIGGNAGTGGAPNCARGGCPALMIRDLEAIDDSKAPGFDAAGFRCKSLTFCPTSGGCVYFQATSIFGSVQSKEDGFSDGVTLTTPAAVRMSIDGGADSSCNNPPITITADEFLTLTVDGGRKVPVYLPMFMGVSLTLYIASDGSTYYDAALTSPARLRPP